VPQWLTGGGGSGEGPRPLRSLRIRPCTGPDRPLRRAPPLHDGGWTAFVTNQAPSRHGARGSSSPSRAEGSLGGKGEQGGRSLPERPCGDGARHPPRAPRRSWPEWREEGCWLAGSADDGREELGGVSTGGKRSRLREAECR
jgi:hypothetical protein